MENSLLTLRLQRTGRKKLAHYRLIAQEHSLSPTSGRVVEFLGSFNPYSKEFTFDKEKVEKRLKNGAQPSNRVAKLLSSNGVKMPDWVTITTKPERKKPEPAKEEKAAPTPEANTDEASVGDEETDTPEETAPAEDATEAAEVASAPAEADEDATTEESSEIPADDTKE